FTVQGDGRRPCGRRRAGVRVERSDFVISFIFSFVLQVPSYTGGSPTGRFDYKCWAAFTLWACHTDICHTVKRAYATLSNEHMPHCQTSICHTVKRAYATLSNEHMPHCQTGICHTVKRAYATLSNGHMPHCQTSICHTVKRAYTTLLVSYEKDLHVCRLLDALEP
ncbi:hypothetical protein B0T09DRAFT_328947, partial [Sordaria sp. MPI-SDFR-AT-0083]